MSTVFLSYKLEDREIAERLQSHLEAFGHTIRIDTNAVLAGGGWRDSLMRALMESDAVVVLITERALQSQFVMSEIGAARALAQAGRHVVLIPIVVGDMAIPPIVQDLFAIRMRGAIENEISVAAGDVDKAVRAYFTQLEDSGGLGPKLFISHRHKDERIVRALVDVLRSAFVIDQSDIRCTSVRPYRLPVGERTSDRLKRELKHAEAVVGILTPDTKESSYVLFELGGAWAQNILTCPLLACGGSTADIPDPIRDINPLSLEDERDCQQFLDDLEDATSLRRQTRVGGDVADRIRKLVQVAGKDAD